MDVFSKPLPPPISEPPNQLASLSRRVKLLEEMIDNLRRKQQIDEQNAIESAKKQIATIRGFGEELDEMKKTLSSMRDDIHLIIKELQMTAKSEEVKVLQKYVDMWEPVQFVTAKQVERMIQDALRTQHFNSGKEED